MVLPQVAVNLFENTKKKENPKKTSFDGAEQTA